MADSKNVNTSSLLELEELARKATPGEWKAFVERSGSDSWTPGRQTVTLGAGEVLIANYTTEYVEYPSDEQNAANAAYIAAANPTAILALLEERRVLREALKDVLGTLLAQFNKEVGDRMEVVQLARAALSFGSEQ